MLPGLVIAGFGRRFLVELEDGREIGCVSRGKKGGIACGDRVEIKLTAADQGVIESVLPRTSLLFRSDIHRQKILAANASRIIIVVAAVPSFYEDLLNRCLVAAEANGIKALIVLNKSDLVQETGKTLETLRLYQELGYRVVPLSARHDISPLRPYLAGHTSVLVGQSGMGKTSIINALLPDVRARTGDVSTTLDSGRHITTHARLYHLDNQSRLIDSPGLQEFGLSHLSPAELDHAFVEFRPHLGRCRFNDCRHLAEPGCAVLEAAAAGKISARRLSAYHKLTKE